MPELSTTMLAALKRGDYRIEPERSSIRIKVKANWGLQKVQGAFRVVQGSLHVDDGGTLSAVSAVIDPASFDSRNGKRDKHITSADFLDAQRHPKISFAGDRVRSEGDGLVLTGTLTVHGVTESVDVHLVKASMEGDAVRFAATARLDRTRFGVSHMPRRVGTDVELAIEAVAAPT